MCVIWTTKHILLIVHIIWTPCWLRFSRIWFKNFQISKICRVLAMDLKLNRSRCFFILFCSSLFVYKIYDTWEYKQNCNSYIYMIYFFITLNIILNNEEKNCIRRRRKKNDIWCAQFYWMKNVWNEKKKCCNSPVALWMKTI